MVRSQVSLLGVNFVVPEHLQVIKDPKLVLSEHPPNTATKVMSLFRSSSCIQASTKVATCFIGRRYPIFATNTIVSPRSIRNMGTITEGVEFDSIAREWRCKWSGDNDKKSLQEAQKLLNDVVSDLKSVDGYKSVQRIVCGGCLDFKVITTVSADKFGSWTETNFTPEGTFLEKLKAIDGISQVEAQTYTIMPM